MNKKDRIHDWRKLKWPFCVTFLYYALLCLYTGSAEASVFLYFVFCDICVPLSENLICGSFCP